MSEKTPRIEILDEWKHPVTGARYVEYKFDYEGTSGEMSFNKDTPNDEILYQLEHSYREGKKPKPAEGSLKGTKIE